MNPHPNIQASFWSTLPLIIDVIAPRRSLKLTIPSPSLSKLLNTICAYLVGSPSGNNLAYAGFKSPDVTHPLGHSCLKARYSLRISSLENPVRQDRVDSCSGNIYNECLSSSWMLSTKAWSSYTVILHYKQWYQLPVIFWMLFLILLRLRCIFTEKLGRRRDSQSSLSSIMLGVDIRKDSAGHVKPDEFDSD